MSEGLNRCTFLGVLAKDAEMIELGNSEVVNFTLAVTERYRAGNVWKEHTEWIPCQWWGPRAKSLVRYLTKGKPLLIEGGFKTRSWEDKSGAKQYKSEIRVTNVVLTAKPNEPGSSGPSGDGDDDEIP